MLKDVLNFSAYNSISPDFPIYSVTDYRRKSIIGLLRFKKKSFHAISSLDSNCQAMRKKKTLWTAFNNKNPSRKEQLFCSFETIFLPNPVLVQNIRRDEVTRTV